MTARGGLTSLICALALLLAGSRGASAQSGSSLGTEFWAVDMDNADRGAMLDFAIVVANSSAAAVTVTIEGNTGVLRTSPIPAGGIANFQFARDRRLRGTEQAPHAYRVTASAPVSAFQFNPLENASTNDASLLLPVPSLGTEYRPLCWHQVSVIDSQGFDLPGSFAIASASASPVTVTIVPNGDVRAGAVIPALGAGVPVQFTLNPFDALQLITPLDVVSDLTGSLILSDGPIAVFAGSRCSTVPGPVRACDHLEEQSFPVSTWGRDYLLAKSKPRGAEPDFWRILAAEDGTTVTLDPDVIGAPVTLDAGEFVEFETALDLRAVADKPISVGQFLVGQDHPLPIGDPALTLMIPTAQFESSYTFLTPYTFPQDYVTVVRPTGVPVVLDGALIPASEFTAIGTTGRERAHVALADGAHRIVGGEPIGAYVHGYGSYASYGYPAGTRTDSSSPGMKCDVGGPYSVPCGGGSVTLDAGGSTGPGPLTYAWSSISAGVTILSPSSVTTQVDVVGSGPWLVNLVVTSGSSVSSCVATITAGAGVPPDLTCSPAIVVPPTSRAGALVAIAATGADPCNPAPVILNDRTSGGADATDTYPCGDTLVTFTMLTSAGGLVTCSTLVTVSQAAVPGGVSDDGVAPWMRVEKYPGDPSRLRISFEDRAMPTERLSLYQGSITPADFIAYDHQPLGCDVIATPSGPGLGTIAFLADEGFSHYYLLSAANCVGEGTRGRRSDGVERPALPTDCGPVR